MYELRGACYRCGKIGHFAEECSAAVGGACSRPFGTASGAPTAGSCAAPPKPDPLKTQRWQIPSIDPQVSKRNDDELRILLKLMWTNDMQEVVKMLFARFGNNNNLGDNKRDASFLDAIQLSGEIQCLVELDFQLGRRAEAHFIASDGRKRKEFIINPLDESIDPKLRDHKVNKGDLQLFAGEADLDGFTNHGFRTIRSGWWHVNGSRHGLPGTLHRLSGISGRNCELIGVVMRVGRTITGIVQRMLPCPELQRKSVLLVGPPNSGKTTLLREFARLLSDRDDRVVVVVDKTSEIAGASNEPHPAIGASTRWMPVDDPHNQHVYMRMAVENLSPDTIIVDEIMTEWECDSAKAISQRGVQLVATCHGKSMTELVNDKDRSTLLGDVMSVTLSQFEVEQRMANGGGASEQALVRKYEPLFGTVIEIHSRDLWYIHRNPKHAVDAYLRQEPVLALRATPGLLEEVVAHPAEDGFRYEPQASPLAGGSSMRAAGTMRAKGSDVHAIGGPAVHKHTGNDRANYGMTNFGDISFGDASSGPPPWVQTAAGLGA